MVRNAEEVFEEAQSNTADVADYVRDAAKWFHKHEGEMFRRKVARESLQEVLDVEKRTAARLIAEMVGDSVDPVVQVNTSKGKFVGVADFREFEGAYGYTEYNDLIGKRKRVVCQQCVNEATLDSEVTQVTADDPRSSFAGNADYRALLGDIHRHYEQEHDVVPEEVETGATLASGTTVGGNLVIHKGNESMLSVYDNYFKVDVGHFSDGTSSITTGFKPSYVEIIAQIHAAGFNSEWNTSGRELGQSHGYASGSASSDQVVISEGDGSASVNGHNSYVGEGEIIYAIQSHNDGEGIDTRSRASISSFDSDGFTLSWSTTGANAEYIYKAYK